MQSVIAIHIILFLVCALYALFLNQERVYKRYHPDGTIFTVIGGNMLIGFAQMAIIFSGTPLTWWLLISTNVAAGIPIAAWQWRQWRERENDRKRGR